MEKGRSAPRKSDSRRITQHAVAFGKGQITQIAGDYHASSEVAAPPTVASLPPDSGLLVGRQEKLQELLDLLSPGIAGGQPIVVAVVTGLPGIGKTALAVHAARRAQQEEGWFDGGVLFADLRGYDPVGQVTSDQILSRWLRGLGTRGADMPVNSEEREDLYRSVLYRLAERGQRVLLVADNASSAEQIRPLVPPRSEHRLLVTSRDSLTSLPARLVEVAQLDPSSAAELIGTILLRARTGDPRPQTEQTALVRLAEICGGLPLALEIVAQILAVDSGLPIARMFEEVKNQRALLIMEPGNGGDRSLGPVQAAFELSYRRLGPEPARLFRLLSLSPGPGITTEVAAALADEPPARARELLAALARASLLDEQPPGSGWWVIHDLMHAYAVSLAEQDCDSTEKVAALDRLLREYTAIAYEAVRQLDAEPGQQIASRFPDRTDALAWLDREGNNLVVAVKLAAPAAKPVASTALIGQSQTACALALTLAPYLQLRFRFRELRIVSELAVVAARELGDRQLEWEATLNLGQAQDGLGRFKEALTAFQHVEQMARADGNRHGEAVALSQCGVALKELRRFDDAFTAYQHSREIFRELGNISGEAAALNAIGVAQEKMGLYQEAAATYRTAVALLREAGDRRQEALTLVNLCGVLAEAGHVQEAISSGYAALAIYEELGDKYGEAKAWHNLGIAIRKVRRFEGGAVAVLQGAVKSLKEAGDHHSAAEALNSLGIALAQSRRSRNRAIDAHQEAIELFTETNDRHGAAKALLALGLVLNKLHRSQPAIAVSQQGRAIFQSVGDIAGEAEALIVLGVSLARARRFDEAVTAFEQAESNFREIADVDHEAFAAHMVIAARKKQRWRILLTATTIRP